MGFERVIVLGNSLSLVAFDFTLHLVRVCDRCLFSLSLTKPETDDLLETSNAPATSGASGGMVPSSSSSSIPDGQRTQDSKALKMHIIAMEEVTKALISENRQVWLLLDYLCIVWVVGNMQCALHSLAADANHHRELGGASAGTGLPKCYLHTIWCRDRCGRYF